jgi:hypothetical protein
MRSNKQGVISTCLLHFSHTTFAESMEAAHYYKRWDLAQLCEGKIVASLSESTICDVLLDLALKIPQSRNAQ